MLPNDGEKAKISYGGVQLRKNSSKSKHESEMYYKRIAETIVKEQSKINEETIKNAIVDAYKQMELENRPKIVKTEQVKKQNIFKVIINILLNKSDTKGRFTSGLFTLMTSIILKSISLVGIIFSVLGIPISIYVTYKAISNGNEWLVSIIIEFVVIFIFIILFLFMIIVWGASNEIEREEDRNFIVSLFSGIVSFAALVVAIIALVKGM